MVRRLTVDALADGLAYMHAYTTTERSHGFKECCATTHLQPLASGARHFAFGRLLAAAWASASRERLANCLCGLAGALMVTSHPCGSMPPPWLLYFKENSSKLCQRLWWLRSEMEPRDRRARGCGRARGCELVSCQEARAHTRLHHVALPLLHTS